MEQGEKRKIFVFPDADELATAAAERVIARIAINPGRVAVCLTGGSGPKKLYEKLGSLPYKNQIPWHRVHWFIGDERFVPVDDPLNNMGMARQTFVDRYSFAANVHPIATDGVSVNEAAELYEAELKAFYGAALLEPARPLFDLVLMGVGPDGHTASLFPGDAALAEVERWVVGVPRANVEPFVPRVTLTLPALASCREMLFLAAGPSKRPILTRLLANENLPANSARSTGETVWLADRAALPEGFRGRR
jgi:6-phosphogluconolactonase